MDVGFAGQGRNSVSNNSKLRGVRKHYKNIRNLYVGTANKHKDNPSHLNPAQIAEGRKRAKAYYTKRNRRINVTIALSVFVGLAVIAVVINKYLLH